MSASLWSLPDAEVEAVPDLGVADLHARVALLARRCVEAEEEFDAAVDAGQAMYFLVQHDREVAVATRRHREALADLAHATRGSDRRVLTSVPRLPRR